MSDQEIEGVVVVSTWVDGPRGFMRTDLPPAPPHHRERPCPTCTTVFVPTMGQRFCNPTCRPSANRPPPRPRSRAAERRRSYDRLRQAGLCVSCGVRRSISSRCRFCAARLAISKASR